MTKIIMGLPVFYPIFGGGPLRFLRYQKGFHSRDVYSRVLSGTARNKDALHEMEDEKTAGCDRYLIGSMLPVSEVEGIPIHRVQLPAKTSIRRTSVYFRALIKICRDPKTRPDVIQLHSFAKRPESLFWIWRLKKLSIPIVYVIQIAEAKRPKSAIVYKLASWIKRAFYNQLDGIVTSSELIYSSLRKDGVQTPIAVIPNGVDLERYRPRAVETRQRMRRELGISESALVLLTIGAVSERKGTDLLLEAWAGLLETHPDVEIIVVGPYAGRNSQDSTEFDARVSELVETSARPEAVHFLGVREDVQDLYAAADLLVLPTAREGGTPNVVLEAMASECPVLITPFKGQSTALGRPGLEFEQTQRSVAALTTSIAGLLSDPDRRDALSRHGHSWITSRLNQEKTLDCFAELYRCAVDGTLKSVDFPNERHPAIQDASGSERTASNSDV